MDNARTYFLKCIANHETNGYSSLGEFHAKHFDDVTKIMMAFVKESLLEAIEHINKGEVVDIGGVTLTLQRNTKRKS